MGFFFRRSSSFGPFRLNFSKSGIGASVGVKGARVTYSAKGTTYVTVGGKGFYYRQNLTNGGTHHSASPPPDVVAAQPELEEIKTADVEELRESSKGELVADLNKRAQMFNPAKILFGIAASAAVVGFAALMDSATRLLPPLPDVTGISEPSRGNNNTDQYAVLLARYGQPSELALSQIGPVPLRTVTWAQAHVAITFVPASCFGAYTYYESHKNDPLVRNLGERHRTLRPKNSDLPGCAPSTGKSSTIVAYEDSTNGSALDAQLAGRLLSDMGAKSAAAPVIKTLSSVQSKKTQPENVVRSLETGYDEKVFADEKQRLAVADDADKRSELLGWGFMSGALLILVPGVLVHRANRAKRTTRLVYQLSGEADSQHQALDAALGQLARSNAIWRLDSQSAVLDWKRNAGAAYNVKRDRISVRKELPPRVESNLVPMSIDMGKLKLFFLPDQLLYWQSGTFASIGYGDVTFAAGTTQFIETAVQTSDSKQVGSTWQYVRKDGGPDQRFNNNRQLPVMLYGVVAATSSQGVNLLLHTTNADSASSFVIAVGAFQRRLALGVSDTQAPKSDEANSSSGVQTGTLPTNIEKAMSMLGLKPGATMGDASVAYKHMAQMYHPDKTAGLGPELQKLADTRMKEINAAYQTVRQFLEQA